MAFEGLSEKLQGVFKGLKGKGSLTEADINTAMREVKLALLEADVNFKVVKEFVASVKEKCLGETVMASLTPGQQVIKIVNEELVELMGGTGSKLTYSPKGFTVYMMVGLQGTGKTTASAKLALHLRKNGRKPLLAACDVYRPAAITQLQVLGKQIDMPVYAEEGNKNPVQIAKNAVKAAVRSLNDVVIIDTAGRLQIDDALMQELEDITKEVKPAETLLVIDAMTGQEAANVAQVFNERLSITGIIMSKLDSDTRGGAALSVRAITGKPVKFASSGEKLSDFEVFYPKRMADRILGMGDVLTLIDKAIEVYDEQKAKDLEKKIMTQKFSLDDFLDQLQQIKKMGGIAGMLKLIPGASQIKESDIDEKQFTKIEAIIQSMTIKERNNPDILNASRRKRIAAGSGTTVQDINKLMKMFEEMRAMMKQMSSGKKLGRFKGLM